MTIQSLMFLLYYNFQDATRGNIGLTLKYLKQRYDVEFGTFKLTGAYEQAINYPFRPEAAKAVVGVIASPCEKSPLPISVSLFCLKSIRPL